MPKLEFKWWEPHPSYKAHIPYLPMWDQCSSEPVQHRLSTTFWCFYSWNRSPILRRLKREKFMEKFMEPKLNRYHTSSSEARNVVETWKKSYLDFMKPWSADAWNSTYEFPSLGERNFAAHLSRVVRRNIRLRAKWLYHTFSSTKPKPPPPRNRQTSIPTIFFALNTSPNLDIAHHDPTLR